MSGTLADSRDPTPLDAEQPSPTAPEPAALPAALPAESPAAELTRRVAGLRTRATGGDLDRVLLLVGGLLLPLGILLVVLGWLGASHTVLVFEQIPYLLSGGVLGLALVFAGGFIYFAYWQTLIVRESRDHQRVLVVSLGRIETLLAGGRQTSVAGTALVATPTGSMIHRPDCPVVAGHEDLRSVDPGTAGFEACKICQPLAGRPSP
jgi:hypothetical protein